MGSGARDSQLSSPMQLRGPQNTLFNSVWDILLLWSNSSSPNGTHTGNFHYCNFFGPVLSAVSRAGQGWDRGQPEGVPKLLKSSSQLQDTVLVVASATAALPCQGRSYHNISVNLQMITSTKQQTLKNLWLYHSVMTGCVKSHGIYNNPFCSTVQEDNMQRFTPLEPFQLEARLHLKLTAALLCSR